ncbi:hypothetical protein AVEN_22122-1 [Araneus ventricosus]|uniref:Uncharacterized protein n=1 Tax=Araneus ventricosus TaxID=182803 RepID=A0A4Y2BWE9_ARAVE|nr:hypothetical protein AVEN_22122-1 [Araneus ventricosus]
MEFLEHGNEKPIVNVETYEIWSKIIGNDGIQKNLNSKTQSTDSNLRPQLEGSGTSMDLPTLRPHVEVILTSRFEATRALLWDGPRNFEPWTDDETTPQLAPLSNLHHTNGNTCRPYVRINVQLAPYTVEPQWNRVSNLESSGPEAGTLSLGHRGTWTILYDSAAN